MARLTSLASVLAALDFPEQRPQARQDREPPPYGPANGEAPSDFGDARRDLPGIEIYESARRQAKFYAAYAEMLETDRRPEGSADAWVREVYPSGQWVGPATLATSYRLAAQHAALVDAAWATKLAVRAGMAYVAAGLPFGLFLLTGLLDDETLADRDLLGDVVGPFQGRDAAEAVRHPAQLTYLLLAAASRPLLRDELSVTLRGAERRLARHGLYPIGPQSVPLGEYTELAAAMSGDDVSDLRGRASPVDDIAARLAGLQRIQAASLRAARRNRYLWRNGAFPVIDLENVALSGLALRCRPWFDQLSEAITVELDRDDELAQLPVWTMDAIDSELPDIGESITDIIREPERAWRSEDFLPPETVVDPWTEERESRSGERRAHDDRRAGRTDSPDTRPNAALDRPPYPGQEPADDDDEGDDGGPYFRDR
jgi:hypothetical protein